MNVDNYVFIYKDSHNKLNTAISIRFIAEHKACVAIHLTELNKMPYDSISDLLYAINERNNKAIKFAITTDIGILL